MKLRYTKYASIFVLLTCLNGTTSQAETFSEAFAKAKSAGLAEFTFEGNLYTTQTAEEAANLTYGPFPITLKGYFGHKNEFGFIHWADRQTCSS
tara:strand:+ start:295 stop:576 length:282 start_codon:yes stop_codon:yes gene_type:complete